MNRVVEYISLRTPTSCYHHPNSNATCTCHHRPKCKKTNFAVYNMIPSFLPLVAIFWLSFVSTLSFSPDSNATIPSILGITRFSYPATSRHLESGYADGVINTDWHQPWPFTQLATRKTYLIRYCFADQTSKDALGCSFPRALQLWVDTLGGAPGVDTGYNLHFIETYVGGQAQFCYADGTFNSETGQGQWNWKLSKRQDALVIAYRPVDEEGNKPVTAATLGYTPEEVMPPWEVKQARQKMR